MTHFRPDPVGVIFLAVVATIAAVAAVKGYRDWRASTTNFVGRLGICIFAVGALGFALCCAIAGWIHFFPRELLDHFELPNTLQADRLTAPDGRVFIVSSPFLRVQRYGAEGFEKGFMVGSKVSRSAMSASGNVLICSIDGELLTYTPDGDELPPRRSCRDRFFEGLYLLYQRRHILYPSHAKVPAIAFNWFSALAVPLWHPFAAWDIGLFGSFLYGAGAQKNGVR